MSLIKIRRIATLNGEDKRDGKDSIASDAPFKVGDLVRMSEGGLTGKITKIEPNGHFRVSFLYNKANGFSQSFSANEIVMVKPAADADSSFAADAKFKIGDKVRRGVQNGIVRGIEKEPYIEVKFTDEPVTVFVHESEIKAANSRAADASGTDANFKVGDKVKLSGSHPRFPNRVAVVTHVFPTGFVKVKVDGIEDIEIAERLISKAQDAAAKDKTPDGWWEGKTIFAAFGWGKSVKGKVVSHKGGVIKLADGTTFKESDAYDLYAIDSSASDAAELRVVHAKGIGKWWVEPNLSRFNDADREQTHKGRKEFPDREAAMKYARGTGKTFIVNDACGNGKDKCGRDGCGKDGDSEYELGMKVFKAVGKVEDEIVAGVRRAKQLVNNVPDEDVKRKLNRKLDDIAKIADSFDETFV